MKNLRKRQTGKSKFKNLLFFVILAYGIIVGVQYVPQKLEWANVQSILEEVQKQHYSYRVHTTEEAWKTINKHLGINSMQNMKEAFEVTKPDNYVIVDVFYERDLNLLFTTYTSRYQQSVTLGEVETLAY